MHTCTDTRLTVRPTASGRVILVVDDDPWIQQLLELVLADEGYTVVIANNGDEALAILDERQPSLILLDWMMPRMNGQQFARELSRRGLRSEIPVLLLTAAGGAPAKAALIGAEACLAKPFDLDELLDRVSQLLAR